MENILVVLVVILALLVLGLFAIMAIFMFKILKLKGQTKTGEMDTGKMSAEIVEAIKAAKAISDTVDGMYCCDHPELHATGTCAISNKVYCDLCMASEKDIKIARKYLDLLLDNEWDNVFMFSNEMLGADKLNELVKIKKELWTEKEIPVIAQKQFKINIETDVIEAYTIVKARTIDSELIKDKFEFLNL